MLLLQTVSTRKWKLINFDVSTAFLKGEGDGRRLGLEAPPEMAQALQMKGDDQCLLQGGAYGRVYFQWEDGSIEIDQRDYIEKISPIQIPKTRRAELQDPVTESERQEIRQLVGSLQYSAVNTRPDLAAKIGEIQSKVTRARVEDMLTLNRVLHEAKTHPVCLHIVPLPLNTLTFCAFSDASFATCRELSSRQGQIIFATDRRILDNQPSVVCPMAWSSRKIARVVRSTLSAEAVALSSCLDRLSWIRLFWKWLVDPSIDLTDPSRVLSEDHPAAVATDCKSVYDIATRTSVPSCEEYRTCLECLLIRERLKESCRIRWVSSRAQLADSLTKSMDGSLLRLCLKEGRYSLYDEESTLKERADHRNKLLWVKKDGQEKKT